MVACSNYSAVGKMEECYSESRGFEQVSGTLLFVDMKIAHQHHATRVAFCCRMCVCVCVGVCVCVLALNNGNCFLLVAILLSIHLVFSLILYFKPLNSGFS